MSDLQKLILNLGSNIDPEKNLRTAVEELKKHGEIYNSSSVWETHAVGGEGPNFLNFCIEIETVYDATQFKEIVIRPLEQSLGRVRGNNKYAPRTIDIDIIGENGKILDNEIWDLAFIVMPLSEIHPTIMNKKNGEPLNQTAKIIKEITWTKNRRDVSLI